MRIKPALAAAAALLSLASVTACEDTGRKPGRDGAATPAQPGAPAPQPGPPSAGSTADAQKYLRRYASCENLATGGREDVRLRSSSVKTVGGPVREVGVCSDLRENGAIGIFLTPDMKEFQEAYHRQVMDKIAAGEPAYGLYSRVFVGKDFVAEPTSATTARALAKSGMRVLTCNPAFGVPEGHKKEKALADSCVLSDFVHTKDGADAGSPEPGSSQGGQPAQPANPGLPSAGSVSELRKLIASSVDCKRFSTDPETVAVRSIDYQPFIEGDPAGWGVGERGLCGQPGGAQRAHGLIWLDKVDDMAALQTRARAVQLKEIQENGGRPKATKSVLLLGGNVAIETNNAAARFGLYQQQFFRLECRPGFTTPEGYRSEKAVADGCTLTNFEPDGITP
ncbi:hypothetical protein [Streptomyces hiroshimensis]|uniref:Lipoprotein n=1 Tax=Streptomyces hiroshimensis TaxID=66424 RepID=A0ABQ2YXT3_9ACTN|nr:hypothetical protein [Streptomyces hiroshimensis]GGX98013.1 hypothetical protein GCM10010324_50430 [Streptomyces hiroshimensis]